MYHGIFLSTNMRFVGMRIFYDSMLGIVEISLVDYNYFTCKQREPLVLI